MAEYTIDKIEYGSNVYNLESKDLKNLVDGSATGSVRGIGASSEANGYVMGQYAIAEGEGTHATGGCSHAEGYGSFALGDYSHAEGYDTMAEGNYSHAQNYNTTASSDYQTAIGKYNTEDANNKYALIVGNGNNGNSRSNALTVDWQGRVECGDYSGVFQSIFDIFYPVGSYYETSDDTFDPNVAWGGTWYKETEGQVHVSSGRTYTVTGADETHLINPETVVGTSDGGSTDAIIPYHNHSFTDPVIESSGGSTSGQSSGSTGAASATTTSKASGSTGASSGSTGAGTSHSHAGASSHAYVMTSNTSVANTTVTSNTSGNRRVYGLSASTGNPFTCTTNTGGESSHTHSLNAHTHSLNEHTHTLVHTHSLNNHTHSTPNHTHTYSSGGSVGYAGTSGNVTDANMQPYIVVNRWHRVA